MNHDSLTEKIIEYIEVNLESDLSLDRIAKAFSYSKYYIARVFAEKTDSTIYQYIKKRRLTVAAGKLVDTDEPIIEIACEAHYDSQQAFTFAFRQLYQCTPQVYRKNGIFYPAQTKLCVKNSVKHGIKSKLSYRSYSGFTSGGKMAA